MHNDRILRAVQCTARAHPKLADIWIYEQCSDNPARGRNASRVEGISSWSKLSGEHVNKVKKTLSPCQQQSSSPDSLEGRWRPSLCIEIQYAEEVGGVLIYSCAHHPGVRIKTMNEGQSCARLRGLLYAANCFSSVYAQPGAGL